MDADRSRGIERFSPKRAPVRRRKCDKNKKRSSAFRSDRTGTSSSRSARPGCTDRGEEETGELRDAPASAGPVGDRWYREEQMAGRTPNQIDVEVGCRIRIHRLNRGLSQTELGREIGVTFQQVQKYEKGTNRVGAGRLQQIAKVLNIPIDVLFGARDDPGKPAGVDRENVDLEYLVLPGALRLVRAYANVPTPELRRAMVDLMEKMAAPQQPEEGKTGEGADA
jgi:transcriptional regulator with XRE-family HTH domain